LSDWKTISEEEKYVDSANVNASQFRCDLSAPVTADRTFWWRAIVE